MLLGEDFEKVSFELFGLDLLEPNAFITDTLITICAFTFAYKLHHHFPKKPFYNHWKYFFIVFGTSFFLGGLGHVFYNQWGIPGKTPPWFLGIIACFFIEQAFISEHRNKAFSAILKKISITKLILALIGALCVSLFVDLKADYSKGMHVPTINSIIGMGYCLAYLAVSFAKENRGYYIFLFGFLMLIPAAIVQSIKLNIHPLFDKNDFSHILIMTSLIFYYYGLKKVREIYIND